MNNKYEGYRDANFTEHVWLLIVGGGLWTLNCLTCCGHCKTDEDKNKEDWY